jgi:hypothetical protein
MQNGEVLSVNLKISGSICTPWLYILNLWILPTEYVCIFPMIVSLNFINMLSFV